MEPSLSWTDKNWYWATLLITLMVFYWVSAAATYATKGKKYESHPFVKFLNESIGKAQFVFVSFYLSLKFVLSPNLPDWVKMSSDILLGLSFLFYIVGFVQIRRQGQVLNGRHECQPALLDDDKLLMESLVDSRRMGATEAQNLFIRLGKWICSKRLEKSAIWSVCGWNVVLIVFSLIMAFLVIFTNYVTQTR